MLFQKDLLWQDATQENVIKGRLNVNKWMKMGQLLESFRLTQLWSYNFRVYEDLQEYVTNVPTDITVDVPLF